MTHKWSFPDFDPNWKLIRVEIMANAICTEIIPTFSHYFFVYVCAPCEWIINETTCLYWLAPVSCILYNTSQTIVHLLLSMFIARLFLFYVFILYIRNSYACLLPERNKSAIPTNNWIVSYNVRYNGQTEKKEKRREKKIRIRVRIQNLKDNQAEGKQTKSN